jgi:hypothetical protein
MARIWQPGARLRREAEHINRNHHPIDAGNIGTGKTDWRARADRIAAGLAEAAARHDADDSFVRCQATLGCAETRDDWRV